MILIINYFENNNSVFLTLFYLKGRINQKAIFLNLGIGEVMKKLYFLLVLASFSFLIMGCGETAEQKALRELGEAAKEVKKTMEKLNK